MNLTKFEPSKAILKKHQPEMIHPNLLDAVGTDMLIRCTVVTMTAQGKTDDEIREVVKTIFDKRFGSLVDNINYV